MHFSQDVSKKFNHEGHNGCTKGTKKSFYLLDICDLCVAFEPFVVNTF